MWKAAALITGRWREIELVVVDGKPPSTESLFRELESGRRGMEERRARLLDHLVKELEPAQDREVEESWPAPWRTKAAIELWAEAAAREALEYDQGPSPPKMEPVQEALALFPSSAAPPGPPPAPTTLAWHDHTAMVMSLSGEEKSVVVEYTPSPRDRNRAGLFRHRFPGAQYRLETILDYRSYYGWESAVVDGWRKMQQRGHGFVATLRGTPGYVVAHVLRRWTQSQAEPPQQDPTFHRRLVLMSEEYPDTATRVPDLSTSGPLAGEHAMVFVHGTVSCGLAGLSDLTAGTDRAEEVRGSIYRYEHDTFRPVRENGKELAELIATKLRCSRLLLVGHSRGGLVSRFASEMLRGRGFEGDIDVYTFGTPHEGTPLVAVGEKAINLLLSVGMAAASGLLPMMAPLIKAYQYLWDLPTLPIGIEIMREGSQELLSLNDIGDPGRVACWASDFRMDRGPSGFAVEVEGALLAAQGDVPHDLVVPSASALAFGRPRGVRSCSHTQYFADEVVKKAIWSWLFDPASSEVRGRPAGAFIGGVCVE